MKKILLATALSLVTVSAYAQSASMSQSGSEAVAVVESAPAADPPAADPSSDPSSGGTSHLDETLHNTPDIAISSYAGGTNPCGIGGQLGVAVAGFGIGGGIATTSKECTMRSWYVLLAATAGHTHNPLYMQWADGIACSNPDLYRVAPPGMCSPVTQRVAVAAPPRVYAQRPVAAPAPAWHPPVVRVAQAQRPAWCDTVTGAAERAYYGRTCGFVR